MRKYLLSILCAVFLLSGCNYLNMVPEKDIETVETVFEQRTKTEEWWKGLYANLCDELIPLGANPAFTGVDEFVPSQALYNSSSPGYRLVGLKVADGLQMSQNPYGDIWKAMYIIIRNCNTFLDNIDITYNLTDEERAHWMADVKAVKAFTYFELLRRYGPICLIPENMEVNLEVSAYQLPRQHVDTCVKEIVRLLDEAVDDIPMHYQRSALYVHTFCKEAVYALKAKVLQLAASPLFNGNIFYSDFKNKLGEPLFSLSYDRNKWLLAAEAADMAAKVCAQGDRTLVEGTGTMKTKLLNHMYNVELTTFSRFDNQEYLLEWKTGTGYWPFTLPRLEGDTKHYNSSTTGCLAPSMKMVEEYYTEHGLPINADHTWFYNNRYKLGNESSKSYESVVALNTTIVNLHLRREPRFYAHIAGDRMYWQRGPNDPKVDYNLLVKAYKGEVPWGSQSDIVISNAWQNPSGYWVKKNTFSWLPTASYGNMLLATETTPIIRLAEVYLMQAEAWNEYLDKPDNRVYDPLDKVRERAGILPVREAWATYSNYPSQPDSKEGMREIIRQEYNIEFAFEGQRYWNIRRWLTAHQVMNEKQHGWNILGATAQSFYNNGEGPIVVWNKHKFVAPRDYLNPFNAEEILISGMVQNPGW